MVCIQTLGIPPADSHWSYGPDYMRRISKPNAQALCGMFPLPRLGYETVVAVVPDGYGGRKRLHVQNVAGHFYLASTDTRVQDWPATFGVQIKD